MLAKVEAMQLLGSQNHSSPLQDHKFTTKTKTTSKEQRKLEFLIKFFLPQQQLQRLELEAVVQWKEHKEVGSAVATKKERKSEN